jgi:uncharacterized protein (TIGR00251 family)
VKLTPRSSRTVRGGIANIAEGRAALQIKVTAPPVDGEANKAVIAFLARELRLRPSDISIESGQSARWKMIHLSGDGPELIARVEAWIAD